MWCVRSGILDLFDIWAIRSNRFTPEITKRFNNLFHLFLSLQFTTLYEPGRVKKEPSPTFTSERDSCLEFFNKWNESDQVDFVEQLLARMCHYQHGHINAYLKPMLQRDFISLLPSKYLSYLRRWDFWTNFFRRKVSGDLIVGIIFWSRCWALFRFWVEVGRNWVEMCWFDLVQSISREWKGSMGGSALLCEPWTSGSRYLAVGLHCNELKTPFDSQILTRLANGRGLQNWTMLNRLPEMKHSNINNQKFSENDHLTF